MPITQPTLTASIQSNILSRWPFPVNEHSTKLIAAYAVGLGTALFNSLSGAAFASGTVVGGAAPPSGPVLGATLSYLPGALTTPPFDLESVFVPPQFSVFIKETGKTLTGEYTPWLKCFTKTLSNTAKKSWSQFVSTWSLPGAVCAGGGTATWIASIPPAPGLWIAGTITTPFHFVMAGTGGVSTYAWKLFDSDFVGAGKAAPVTVPIQASKPVTTQLIVTDPAEKIAKAIAGGFADTVASVISSVTVSDPTGSGGSGAAAPGGIVTGTLVGARLNLLA